MNENKEKVETIAVPNDNKIQSNDEVINLKKQLESAQKELSSKGELLTAAEQELRSAEGLIQIIQSDPKLVESIREKYQRMQSPDRGVQQDEQKDKKSKEKGDINMENDELKELGKEVSTVKKNQRDLILNKFEERVGISDLSPEEQADFRKNMGKNLAVYGKTINDVPLEMLDSVLHTSYKAVITEKAINDGKLEGLAEAYTNQSGSFGSMKGRQLADVEAGTELTKEQKDWNAKLGVDNDKAQAIYKDKDNEHKRPNKVEQKKQESN